MFNVMGAAGMVRGDQVRVQLGNIDAMALDVNGTVIEKITSAANKASEDASAIDDAMEDLDEAATGPIALALNVNETPANESAP
jgi:exoribonuclease-2